MGLRTGNNVREYQRENVCSREELMHKIAVYSFAAVDANLYLDAYPDNKLALEYFNKYNKLLADATAEYNENYGPLSANAVGCDCFDWTQTPWPWQ